MGGKIEKNLYEQNNLPTRISLTLPGTLKFLLLGSPRGPLQLRNKLRPRGGPTLLKAWFKDRNVWVCNCVAACWEGFHQCTDALENQIWTWGMFFGDGKWVLMTCLYFADGSSTKPFFVKKQYPPFALKFFLNSYKMVTQKVNIPHHPYSTCSWVLQLSSTLTIINDCCSLIFLKCYPKEYEKRYTIHKSIWKSKMIWN